MIASLLVFAMLQQHAEAPTVMLATDRDRVAPGDVVVFTIRVSSKLPDPIKVDIPDLGGFELESRSERSDVTDGGNGGRTTTIQLHLRATTPGEWRLGPVSVRQGIAYSQGDPVTVTIIGGSTAPSTANLSPRLSRIVQRAPPPDALGPAGISVALSDEEVSIGQQMDVVTIAWFERGLRQQLRRAPTVESPHIEGVWSYPQPVPGGIAATRQVNGKWYDLFVLHQVVFPLTPGRVKVSPARLQYSVPLAYQFFSQEEPYKLESRAQDFTARPLPAEGREPGFTGATGRGLTITATVTPATGRQGEAFTAEVEVRGEGNVALWPEPAVQWPAAFRVYPQAAHERITMSDGRLGGTKTFAVLLVADSAGAIGLPPIRYPYFDIGEQRYRIAEGAGPLVVVAPRGESVSSRAEPPPIRLDTRRPIALTVQRLLPGAVWWILLLLPPVILLLPLLPKRRRVVAAVNAVPDPLARVERLVGEQLRMGGLAGADRADLEDLAGRLQEARFAEVDAKAQHALIATAERALAQMAPRARPGQGRWRERTGLLGLLLLTGTGSLRSQTAPEQLYEAGAFHAAAHGFEERALAAPDVTANWFNLGNAAYRAGDDARALVGWVRAARLSPRDGSIRRALQLVAPADPAATKSLWIAPFTPAECWLLGLIVWLTGWAGILITRSLRGRWVVLLAGGALLIVLGAGLDRWYASPLAILSGNDQLRLSPTELAPGVGEVARLGTVRLLAARPGWVEVDAGAGQRGWVRQEVLQPLAGGFPR